ncbi:MAG TPA: Gfo/Idh/MocA family oxidoreductase [Candidatus Latescibacteria bacterium]|nr:Gfo/Idh/MocA family oxidoreductase [Candidatus Latescibacterota bacterium]
MSRLRVGLSSANRSGSFMNALNTVTETVPVACCDPNTERLNAFCERWGLKGYTDFDQMLDGEKLDLVIVASPMQFHAPQCIAAMKAGAHVMSEVPATVSLDECWNLLATVKETGKKYMMAENYCYMRHVVLVKAMAEAGLFGEMYYAEGAYIHDVRALHKNPDGSPTWRVTWQVGRNGVTYPTHSLGPCIQWMKERVKFLSCLGTGVHTVPSYVNEDTTVMLCKTDKNNLINIRLDMVSNRPHIMNYYSLQGTKGCYEAARAEGEPHRVWLEGYAKDRSTWQSLWDFEPEFMPEIWRNPPEEAKKAGHGGGDYFVVREFVDSILNDTKPPIDIYDALDYTAPGLVSEMSINQGGVPLPVPDFRAAK